MKKNALNTISLALARTCLSSLEESPISARALARKYIGRIVAHRTNRSVVVDVVVVVDIVLVLFFLSVNWSSRTRCSIGLSYNYLRTRGRVKII
jgi:hypothetical protein